MRIFHVSSDLAMLTLMITLVTPIVTLIRVTPANAFLEATEESLNDVKQVLSPKSEKMTAYSTHTIHEFTVGNGTIRAYSSRIRGIFAYTGHHQIKHPPASLFGPYLQEYRNAIQQVHQKYGRRPLSINTEHIRFGISGPQGSLRWSISLQNLPAGVKRDDIR